MSEGYLVDIKPSARRTNGAVGRLLNRRGSRHRFDSREDAERWARLLSVRGERTVWIRTANPDDASGVDAYLMGRRPPSRRAELTVVGDGDGSDDPTDQSGFDEYDHRGEAFDGPDDGPDPGDADADGERDADGNGGDADGEGEADRDDGNVDDGDADGNGGTAGEDDADAGD